MLTEEKLEKKKKDFRGWAREEAKKYILNIEKGTEERTPGEVLASAIECFGKDRLMKVFHYSESQYYYLINWYNTCFWRGYEYWKKKIQKHSLVMLKYKTILDEALEFGNNIDVSDLVDDFPCGDCHLYLAEKHRNIFLGEGAEETRRKIRHGNYAIADLDQVTRKLKWRKFNEHKG